MLAWRLLRGYVGNAVTMLSTVKVYNSSTQVWADQATDAWTFTNAEYDPDAYWTIANPTRLTIPTGKGGVPFALIGGSYTATSAKPTSDMSYSVYKNGVVLPRDGGETIINPNAGGPSNGVGKFHIGPSLFVLADADYIEVHLYVDGGPMTFGHASDTNLQSWLALVRLST